MKTSGRTQDGERAKNGSISGDGNGDENGEGDSNGKFSWERRRALVSTTSGKKQRIQD